MKKHKLLKRLPGALTVGGAVIIWSVGASAAMPLGIQGDVTVQNDANNPVPVVVQGQGFTPVNSGDHVFLDVACFSPFSLYTVPDGKLLIIEDASASANLAAGGPDPTVPVTLSLQTSFSGTTARTNIGGALGVPQRHGRTMKTYADPNTEVFFGVASCTEDVNVSVSFSGRLVDAPAPN
jgi:hypothetical protein